MKQAILTLITAIAISAVAAYFSIVGLAALFAATATGVIVMATVLEVGKIVTVKWVHSMWKNHRVKLWFKGVLMIMVTALMAVTSLGIYGYLSKGHLEQNAPLAGIELQADGLERKIAQKEAENRRLESRLNQIDENISSFISQDQATRGLRASERLSGERTRIQQQIDANYSEINRLSEELVPLKEKSSAVEAKLGPVKYVAELFGLSDPESAVRIVILLIMIAFDPLAICLVIAASISYEDWLEKKQRINVPSDQTEHETLASDEESRLELLRRSVKEDVIKTRNELNDIQSAINAEREDLDIRRKTLDHALNQIQNREEQVESYANDVSEAERALQQEIEDLQNREIELNQRIELLEMIFPKGTTDDQAIVNMLERNPKILEDIIDIVNSGQNEKNSTRPTTLVVKTESK